MWLLSVDHTRKLHCGSYYLHSKYYCSLLSEWVEWHELLNNWFKSSSSCMCRKFYSRVVLIIPIFNQSSTTLFHFFGFGLGTYVFLYLTITFHFKSLNISKVVTFLSICRHISAFSKRRIKKSIWIPQKIREIFFLHFKVLNRGHDFEFLFLNVKLVTFKLIIFKVVTPERQGHIAV